MLFLARILTSGLALFIADKLIGDVSIKGGFESYLVGGIVLGLLFTLLRPILKFFASPLTFITFGLFNIVIVASLVWLADKFLAQVEISSLMGLILSSIIIEIVSGLLVFI